MKSRLLSLCVFAGGILCLSTTLAYFGEFSWWIDLFSHFRVQYLIGLALISGILFLAARQKTAFTFLAFALMNLLVVLPMYFSDQKAPAQTNGSIRAMLINVNTQFGDPAQVRKVVQESSPDILVLEEINLEWMLALKWLTETHPHMRVKTREDNFGIGLFSKFPLSDDETLNLGLSKTPTLVGTLETGQGPLRIIAAHLLPPSGAEYSLRRNDQMVHLADYTQSSLPLILIGDLNTTPWNTHFQKLLANTGLLNSSSGWGIQATWPSAIPILRIPLDHLLHSSNISILQREVGPDAGSDHFPIIVDFAIIKDSSEK